MVTDVANRAPQRPGLPLAPPRTPGRHRAGEAAHRRSGPPLVSPAEGAGPPPGLSPVSPGPDRALAVIAPPSPLPAPPLAQEKYVYVKRHGWMLTTCSVLSFAPLAASQVLMMEGSRWFWLYAPFVALGVAGFALPLLTDRMGAGFDVAGHKRLVARWQPPRHPSVDLYLPVCGEPIEVIRNTWDHVTRLRAHYPGNVVVWVLDDGNSRALKAMAREYGFAYATRPDRGWYMKSGNLRYGFHLSNSEFILLLDADFAPREDLLDETLPYMYAYPDTGIVQTPQYFHVQDQQTWIERGAGSIQELFYRYIQTSRAKKGGAICCGSCALYRRAALEQNGGMSLAEHSEDLHTGFDLQLLGWKLRYIPVALSTGNCPDNMPAFVNQQYRWCSGTMSLLLDRRFWTARLPLYTRMCWITGFIYYLYTSLYTFALPAFSVAMLIFAPELFQLRRLLYFIPYLLYLFVIYPAWHRAPYRLEAWAARMVLGWAHAFVFWDLLRGRPRAWKPSGADGSGHGRQRFWIGVAVWSGGTSAAWAGLAFWRMLTANPYDFLFMLILGAFEMVIVGRILIQPRPGTAA